jgi:hypothetical protein
MLQRWTLEAACDEYTRYTFHKQRFVDKQFIERFDPRQLAPFPTPAALRARWLPEDYASGCSALEAAIAKGLLAPELAAEGLSVPAIEGSHPEEPGVGGGGGGGGAQCAACAAAAAAAGVGGGTGSGGGGGGTGSGGGGGCAACAACAAAAAAAAAPPAPPAPCVCLSQLAQSLVVPRCIVPLSGGLTGLVFARSESGAGEGAGAGSWGAGGLNRCHAPGLPCATCPTCSQERKVGVF